jgi:hypothetical protein
MKNKILQPDYSTVNKAALSKLPIFKCPPTYHVDGHMGSGCAGDPPGYPSYFLRHVYTQYGNSPRKGASVVLLGHVVESSDDWHGCDSWEAYHAKIGKRLASLYDPLPFGHPRVQEWVAHTFSHLHSCYRNHAAARGSNDRTVIYPVPYYKLRTFTDDPRFSDEWRRKERASIEQANIEIVEQARKIATVGNNEAVIRIREHYPDFKVEDILVDIPISPVAGSKPDVEYVLTHGLTWRSRPGLWYERYAHKPEPDECPGEDFGEHPVNGKWCQVCGWSQPG